MADGKSRYKDPDYFKKYYQKNKDKIKKRAAEYQQKVKNTKPFYTTQRKSRLKQQYGLTLEDHRLLIEKQNGVCAICGKVETRQNQWGITPLCVDHCHSSGLVRGLLCSNCNKNVGVLETWNIAYKKNIQKYLKGPF